MSSLVWKIFTRTLLFPSFSLYFYIFIFLNGMGFFFYVGGRMDLGHESEKTWGLKIRFWGASTWAGIREAFPFFFFLFPR